MGFLANSAASMKKLQANWCRALVDVSVLHDMVNLEDLSVWDLPTTDYSFVKKMPKLKKLGLKGAEISDLSLFAGLENLRTLYLSEGKVPADTEEQLKEILPEARAYVSK